MQTDPTHKTSKTVRNSSSVGFQEQQGAQGSAAPGDAEPPPQPPPPEQCLCVHLYPDPLFVQGCRFCYIGTHPMASFNLISPVRRL